MRARVSFKGLLIRSARNVNVCMKCLRSYGGESSRNACYASASGGCNFSLGLQCQPAKCIQKF